MTVNTDGLIVTKVKEVQLIGNLLHRAFTKLVRHGIKTDFPGAKGMFDEALRHLYRLPTVSLSDDAETLLLNFKFRGTSRTLNLFLHCDSDNQMFGKHSLSLSLGCFGNSEEFMKLALLALSPLGPTWYDANDCDDTDKSPFEPSIKNLGEIFSLGFLTAWDVEKRLKRYDEGVNPYFISESFDKNMSPSDFEFIRNNLTHEFAGVRKEDWIKARWDRLKAHFLDMHGLTSDTTNPLVYIPVSLFSNVDSFALEELKAKGLSFSAQTEMQAA